MSDPSPPHCHIAGPPKTHSDHDSGISLLVFGEATDLAAHGVQIAESDFVAQWVAHGRSRTDAPVAFHQIVSIVLLAVATDRRRWLDMQHKRIYPSIFGFNIAASGLRKSTALDYGNEATSVALNDRLLSNDYSAEALIEDLSLKSRTVSRGVAFIDEAGRLLGTMRNNKYGEGLKDLLSKLWDAPSAFSRTLKQGKAELKEVFVNLIMSTTRGRFADLLTPEDVTSGFLARFLPTLVIEPINRRPLSRLDDQTRAMALHLTNRLTSIREAMEIPGSLALTSEALSRMDRAEQELETWAARQFHTDLVMPWGATVG